MIESERGVRGGRAAFGAFACGERGGIGRRAGFRFQFRKEWRFKSSRPHQFS